MAYIKVDGVTVHNASRWVEMENGSNHNEVTNSTFYNDSSFTGTSTGVYIQGGSNQNWPTHNWIHNNYMSGFHDGSSSCTDDGADMIKIGAAYGTWSGNPTPGENYNTIENNYLEYAGHSLMDSYGNYTVIKNNIFHNEPWLSGCSTYTWPPTNYTNASYDGKFGHRGFSITEDYNRTGIYNLVEGNRSGHASVNPNNDGADNFDIEAPQNIVRYNFLYNAMNNGLMFKYSWSGGGGGGGHGGTYNRVYNNTLHNNGYGYPYYHTCGGPTCPESQTGIADYVTASGQGNVVKNNIIYNSQSVTYWNLDTGDRGDNSSIFSEVASMVNNWCTSNQPGCSGYGDPKFTNPDVTNPLSQNLISSAHGYAATALPDLTLQSSSPAIDRGTSLTTATNSGSNSTVLTVADALYFQDGTWGSSLARASAGLGGTFQADWIAIGTVSNVVQISSITYGTYNNPAGTITLASPMTWSNGAPIWLYKKSDGTQVLYGAAPDMGASEYGSGGGGGATTFSSGKPSFK